MMLSNCLAATNGRLIHGDCDFNRLSTDTRTLQAEDIFVALRGERYDGHAFLAQAADAGACGLVVDTAAENIDLPQLIVNDTTKALGAIASLKRQAFRGELIAITGSSGKTTVKGMVAAILASCGSVTATRGNYNNHIGVPLTLMMVEPTDDYAVIEMGTSGVGEIAYLTSLAKPTIALVNNVMPAHLQGFGNLRNIALEKGCIYEQLRACDTAVVNLNDESANRFIEITNYVRRYGYFFGEPAVESPADMHLVCARNIVEDDSGRASFTLAWEGGEQDVQLAVLGRHNVANALAAATCALVAGAKPENIAAGLAAFYGEAGRMQVRKLGNSSTLIDDTYNANPGSVRAGIDYLAAREGTKILIMGDLGELGEGAEQAHRELGVYAREAGIDAVFACGELTSYLVDGFDTGATHFRNQQDLIAALPSLLPENAVVLVKGSHSARMENVVSALCPKEKGPNGEGPTQKGSIGERQTGEYQ